MYLKKKEIFLHFTHLLSNVQLQSIVKNKNSVYVPFCLFSFHKVSNVSCRKYMACQIYLFMSIIIYDNRQSYLKVNTVIINHKIWNVSEMRYLSYLCLDYTIDWIIRLSTGYN